MCKKNALAAYSQESQAQVPSCRFVIAVHKTDVYPYKKA